MKVHQLFQDSYLYFIYLIHHQRHLFYLIYLFLKIHFLYFLIKAFFKLHVIKWQIINNSELLFLLKYHIILNMIFFYHQYCLINQLLFPILYQELLYQPDLKLQLFLVYQDEIFYYHMKDWTIFSYLSYPLSILNVQIQQ